jgi:imidazolonepropionase-like amidohydrolase
VVTLAATSLLALVVGAQQPGTPGGQGLALLAAKALVAELDGRQVVDQALVLVVEGKIEAVAPRSELEIPVGYVVRDLGLHWIMPGLVDLHTHVSGSGINDTVYQINSGLRVAPTTVPGNPRLERALAAGVTTVLYIPGSGSNMGGQGILMKTGFDEYERALVRDPGSLRIAQGDNPTRWGYGMGRLLMNHHLRKVIEQGLAYAHAWDAFAAGTGDKPERDLRLDIFRDLAAHRTQVSAHTQYFQLVMMSILMLARDYDLDVYIDHGSFDSYLNTDIALEHNVAAILGPREVMWPSPPRFRTDGQVQGSAWGFQQQGHTMIGFNTDAPVVPLEELPLQGAMGARYGMDNSAMQVVRGLTIVPATVAGIGHRLGSLEPGKDADLVVLSGDPADPRTSVEQVYLEGERVYDTAQNRRRW